MTSTILLCNSAGIGNIAISKQRIACWIHVDRAGPGVASEIALQIAERGAVHIAISGVEASHLHDEIDDTLIDVGYNIATTWHEETLNEVAWDFMNVDFVSGGIVLRCIVVVGSSKPEEFVRISEIAGYIAKSFGDV